MSTENETHPPSTEVERQIQELSKLVADLMIRVTVLEEKDK